MTPQERKVIELALEALETCYAGDYSTGHVIDPSFDEDAVKEAIIAIKEALAQPEDKKCENCGEFGECCQDAQPEQEPVAWYDIEHGEAETVWNKQRPPWEGRWKPLYTTPPQRKPLTDEQINEVLDSMKLLVPSRIARAIEAAHGIKE